MRITLIRHGMTPGNRLRQYIGSTDQPLAPEGAAFLRPQPVQPQQVLVTPLRRTAQTAALLFPNARQTVVDDLREMDFGDFECRSYADMADDPVYRAWVEGGCLAPCPNGESMEAFSRRVCTAFSAVVAEAAARQEDDLYFVIHGGAIMAILEHFALPRRPYFDYAVDNVRGYVCRAVPEGGLTLTELTPWAPCPGTEVNA